MKNRIRRGGLQTPRGFLFELSGGDVSLDFVNTLDLRPTPNRKELIPTYADLVSWAHQVGFIDAKQEQTLRRNAKQNPAKAEKVRKRAVAIRETLFDLLSRWSDGKKIPEDLMRDWNRIAHLALSKHDLVVAGDSLSWRQRDEGLRFDSFLWPVIQSAVQLLSGPQAARIRKCAADRCDWMFLDTSKRGNRRWCDMTVCGNRAKVKRFYSKQKKNKKLHP